MRLGVFIALLRQGRAKKLYRSYRCIVCEGPVSWIPEAPGSTEGLHCDECGLIWNEDWDGKRSRVRIHPYARAA